MFGPPRLSQNVGLWHATDSNIKWVLASFYRRFDFYRALLRGGRDVDAGVGSQPDAGPWDFWGLIILGFHVVPALIIPVFLVRAFRQKRCIRLGKVLPWLLRGVCLSVIFAMCDSWWATEHTNTLFSVTTWATRDGGTRGYVGFGYCLTYYRSLSGERGPAVWFWFTPFVIDTAHRKLQVRWLWSQ